LRRHRLAGRNQIGNQTVVDVEIALVLAEVAHIVALGEHAPDLGAEAKRVR